LSLPQLGARPIDGEKPDIAGLGAEPYSKKGRQRARLDLPRNRRVYGALLERGDCEVPEESAGWSQCRWTGTSLTAIHRNKDRNRANSCEKHLNRAFFRFIATGPAGMVRAR
jgi:hypothetical protein